jgi:hypothetical protein
MSNNMALEMYFSFLKMQASLFEKIPKICIWPGNTAVSFVNHKTCMHIQKILPRHNDMCKLS